MGRSRLNRRHARRCRFESDALARSMTQHDLVRGSLDAGVLEASREDLAQRIVSLRAAVLKQFGAAARRQVSIRILTLTRSISNSAVPP